MLLTFAVILSWRLLLHFLLQNGSLPSETYPLNYGEIKAGGIMP